MYFECSKRFVKFVCLLRFVYVNKFWSMLKLSKNVILSSIVMSILYFPSIWCIVNPLHAGDLFLYPPKTSEKQRISDNSRRYRKKPVALNG